MLHETLKFKGNCESHRTLNGKLGFLIISSLHGRTFPGGREDQLKQTFSWTEENIVERSKYVSA